MRTRTRSPTPCASRSRDCASASANPGSSPPWPAPGTASTQDQTTGAREGSVDRAPGLSVRLKLTLSYAGFLMLAGALLLAVGYFSLSRGVHPGVIFMVRSHADLLRAFAPTAAIVLAFLLVFGLLGGWLLAGRMLAPLTRITDATRTAANGSLSHRIQLPGRRDEFRELADGFDTMLARLEAHVANSGDSQPMPRTNCAPRWRSRRHFSTSPAKIRTATPANSSTASTPSTPERSTSPKHCSCSAAPTNDPSPENTSTCPS